MIQPEAGILQEVSYETRIAEIEKCTAQASNILTLAFYHLQLHDELLCFFVVSTQSGHELCNSRNQQAENPSHSSNDSAPPGHTTQ